MDTAKLTAEYLGNGSIMQLATSRNDQPWVCSVYYVADDSMNIYWLSYPQRRHSEEIAVNPRVAATIPIKLDKPVAGVQIEGTATIISEADVIQKIMKQYVEKYDAGQEFYDNFVAGKNKHNLYKLSPKNVVLFDEFNFPDDGRKVVEIPAQ